MTTPADKPVNQLPETIMQSEVESAQRLALVINKLVRSIKALNTDIEQLAERVSTLEDNI